MSRTRRMEVISAGVLVAVGLVSVAVLGDGRDWVMPRVLTYTVLAIGVLLGLRAVVINVTRAEPAERSREGRRGKVVDLSVFVFAAVAYIVLIPLVGYWLMSACMVMVMAVYLAVRRNAKTVALSALFAVALSVVGYVMFTHVLYVPIPANDVVTGLLKSIGL